jgi:DNA-directed RNA polymerase subunit F
MEIKSEELITDAEAKEILENREKEIELKYEQKNALDVLRKFVNFSNEKIKALVNDLRKIEKLRDRHIVAIANFLPEDKDDLRAVLHKDYTIFTEDEISLILETVKKNI